MDVQGVGGAPGMNPAAQPKQAEQAQEQQQVQAAKPEGPRQDVPGGTAPGVGQNVNITV